jgi:hypothetical protein
MLARYFRAREQFGDLAFDAMKEAQPTELDVAWLDVSRHFRAELRERISCHPR